MDDRVSVPEQCSGLFYMALLACSKMDTTDPIAGSVKLAPPPSPTSSIKPTNARGNITATYCMVLN
jgi:hypothetical protein